MLSKVEAIDYQRSSSESLRSLHCNQYYSLGPRYPTIYSVKSLGIDSHSLVRSDLLDVGR